MKPHVINIYIAKIRLKIKRLLSSSYTYGSLSKDHFQSVHTIISIAYCHNHDITVPILPSFHEHAVPWPSIRPEIW